MEQPVALKPAPLSSRFQRRIQAWFTDHADSRTLTMLEREKYIFGVPSTGAFSRWMVVLPVLVVQICIGSLYSWSIFNSVNDKLWGTPGLNANAFLLGVASFGLAALLFGTWVERNGPYAAVRVTIVFTPAGWALACLGTALPNYGVEMLFGVCHGIGVGFAYIAVTSCLQRWFSEFKGLATGIAVMGFGLGSFFWTTLGHALMDPLGPYARPPWQVQGIFAAIFLCCLVAALPFLREPPPGWKPDTHLHAADRTCRGAMIRMFAANKSQLSGGDRQYKFTEALATQEMWLVALTFFCVEITGLVFLSSAADMAQNTFNLSAGDAANVTSYLNLVNFAGRVAWGFVSDKLGRKTFYLGSAVAQAFAVGLMSVWISTNNYPLWLLSFLVIGSLYGGGFGVIPAFVSDLFGPKISAATHGVMIAVWATAAVIGIPCFSSVTARNYTLNAAGTKIPTPAAYIFNSYWLCALPALAVIALLFLNVRLQDRALRQAKRDLRIRVFTHVLRINFAEGGMFLLGPKAQHAEWMRHIRTVGSTHIAADAAAAAGKAGAIALSSEYDETDSSAPLKDSAAAAGIESRSSTSSVSSTSTDDQIDPINSCSGTADAVTGFVTPSFAPQFPDSIADDLYSRSAAVDADALLPIAKPLIAEFDNSTSDSPSRAPSLLVPDNAVVTVLSPLSVLSMRVPENAAVSVISPLSVLSMRVPENAAVSVISPLSVVPRAPEE